MGCGQSKIHLYPRKSKSKANGKKSGHRFICLLQNPDTDADADEEEGHIDESGEKESGKDKDRIEEETTLSDGKSSPEPPNGEISVSLLRAKNLSLLQSQEISTSQQNFFRMLDQKIEEGPDYDSASETEIALEEARLNALVQHWESASLTASLCSSASRSLQTTPVRQVPIRPPPPFRHPMNSIPPQPLSAELLPHNAQQQQQAQQQPQPMPSIGLGVGIGVNVGGGLVVTPQQFHQIQQQQQQAQQFQQIQQMQQIQQIQLTPQLQQQQAQVQQPIVAAVVIGSPQTQLIGKTNLSPKRAPDGRTLLPQSVIHQTYGVSQQTVIAGRQRQIGGIPTHMQMAYYGHPPPQSYFGEVLHPMQVQQPAPEYRFPPPISVNRLAPQVQRQIRETQELIKDSCSQLYAAGYGSPGPPLRTQPRNARRPTLETQYSQELS